jgi:protoporphyrinogen/coproporphyrinogen III oxidase
VAASRVVIVGGGISGLAAAHFLSKHGQRLTLIEKEPRLGGLIRTDRVDGCDLEAGPDSFIATKPELRELAGELGIEDRIISSNDAQRRVFIARKGTLKPMPAGMVMMAPSDVPAALRSTFFSAGSKLRFLRELFCAPRQRQEDVSLGEFVREHFGEEVLESIAEPLLTAVYGGDARSLSVESVLPRFLGYERDYGSLIRGVRQERRQRTPGASLFQSFVGGMQTITDTLERDIARSTRICSTEATQVKPIAAGWRVMTVDGPHDAENVILAVPAPAAALLLQTSAPDAAAVLAEIPYSSAILVTTLFARAAFAHPLDGFGFLVPRKERETVAAATWVNTKFPSRVAADRVALRSFVVADEAVQLAWASDDEIIHRVRGDLRRWMGIENEPVLSIVTRWPCSMAQYTVGHSARIKTLHRMMEKLPGLHLCGNSYLGIGLPDCVRAAREVTQRISTNFA